jgi:TonB-dependent starch-binding outer membrane protein SusC
MPRPCQNVRPTRSRGGAGVVLAFLALLVAASPALAQQGSVQGRVVDQGSLRPMNAVQVYVQGQNIGGVTDAQGRFRIDGVAAGQVTVMAQIIGYATESSVVSVTAGAVVDVNFQLRSRAITMDDIVVTGTGAPAQRRQLGQTINSVDGAALQQSPITTVADALQGRVPGIGGQAMGETGAATRITLRGVASLNTSLRNEPLIYVDGIRMDNRTFAVGGVAENRLGDINPADIERIEVIKGAAAATLFGTEASSGVIQIFTKRGAAQAPVWTFGIDQQIIHLPHSKWPFQAGFNRTTGEVVQERPAEAWVDLGYHQNYTMAVRGGSPGIQYSLSGRFMDEDGHLPNHNASNASVRSGFDFTHSERLNSSVNVSVTRNTLSASWPNWSSIGGDFLLANPANARDRFTHGESEMPIADRLAMEDESVTNNISLSGNVVWNATDDITATFRVGHNDVSRKRTRFAAEGDYFGRPGVREITNSNTYATTLDANLNWNMELGSRITSTTTGGGQAFFEGITNENASKSQFASPTLQTLTGASTVNNLTESRQDVINAGVFVQQQFGLDNRLFFTAGLRMDGNSAFGEDFGLTTYPKVGFSWVVSDHDFFNVPGIDEFRIRGAIGTSGLQPGAFDAQRTWNPAVFAGGDPRITPSNLGNPELKPERSTEREVAVEVG